MPLSRRELKQRSSELNALMHDWDPIGVMRDPNWPRDEYEWLVGPLLTLLESGATEAEIGSRLRKEIVEYLGLSPEHYDFPAMGHACEFGSIGLAGPSVVCLQDFCWRRLQRNSAPSPAIAVIGEGFCHRSQTTAIHIDGYDF